VCAPRALERVGTERSVHEVIQVVLRDRDYYGASGGGLTLSGGEPLFQPEFALALLEAAKQQSLHCCVETSGYALWGALRDLLPVVDLWLYDYKETDSGKHEEFTGKPHKLILENLERLHAAGASILLRCPMIPQCNARTEHLDGIVAISRRLPNLQGVELLPYYDYWRGKLARFGLTSRLSESVRAPDVATVSAWKQYLEEQGVRMVG
jgi:pyruvate formate lyase activating enzyme